MTSDQPANLAPSLTLLNERDDLGLFLDQLCQEVEGLDQYAPITQERIDSKVSKFLPGQSINAKTCNDVLRGFLVPHLPSANEVPDSQYAQPIGLVDLTSPFKFSNFLRPLEEQCFSGLVKGSSEFQLFCYPVNDIVFLEKAEMFASLNLELSWR
jgi:hypothetical protein